MKYLGHVVCKEGIKTDPDKIQCVADWPVPNEVRKLKCFPPIIDGLSRTSHKSLLHCMRCPIVGQNGNGPIAAMTPSLNSKSS